MPLVSIIVPVYNAEKYLEKCLESLVNQTLKDIEIILVDDGSKDSSLSICKNYEQKYENIKVLSQKNQGPSAARNNALNYATGKYIGFVDSDDFVKPETFELASKELDENQDTELVIWGTNVVSDDNLPYVNWFEETYFKLKYSGKNDLNSDILFSTAVVPWNKLYRSSIIKEHSVTFPEGRLYEDNAFWWKYIAWCKKIIFLDEKLHFYNMRETSLRGEVIHKKEECEADRIYMVEDVYNYYSRNDLAKSNKDTLDNLFLKSFLDAYEETSDKLKITILGKILAEKMNLTESNLEEVKNFALELIKKYESVKQLNTKSDAERASFPLSEDAIKQAVLTVKENVDYFKNPDNQKTDTLVANQKLNNAKENLLILIRNYLQNLTLNEEFDYLKDFFREFPNHEQFNYNKESEQINLDFLISLFKKNKPDELIKFAQIFCILYPHNFEYVRMIGDAYMFLKKEPNKAFNFYNIYVSYIKDNESVYNVMADICGQNGDVFNQLVFKKLAFQCREKSN